MSSRPRRAAVALLAAGLAPAVITGCSSAGAESTATRSTSAVASEATSVAKPAVTPSSTPTSARPASVAFTPADGTRKVRPDAAVVVKATGGKVKTVTVTDDKGAEVKGALAGETWQPGSSLALGSRFVAKALVELPDGRMQTASSSFRTLEPAAVAKYALLPMEDTVGVGMPAMVNFSTDIPQEHRAEIERRMVVTTVPKTVGSWGWLGDRQVMWRPQAYWKPGTKVTVETKLEGTDVGDGHWITRNDKEAFTIARSMVTRVDMNTHHATVLQDGKPVKTIPVTTGKPGFVTRSGTKVIMEKVGHMTMDSETVGIPKGNPEYYKLDTEWNMRLTTTGEFLHAAPWSQWAQGERNVSHGCTNMSLKNAHWLFQNSMVGDVVEFTGSNRPFVDGEGITVWQYSWAEWQKKSALSR